MKKRGKTAVKLIAFSEIYLMIMMSVAFAVILMNTEQVNAETPEQLAQRRLDEIRTATGSSAPSAAQTGAFGSTLLKPAQAQTYTLNKDIVLLQNNKNIGTIGKIVDNGKAGVDFLDKEGAKIGHMTSQEFDEWKKGLPPGASLNEPASSTASYKSTLTGVTGAGGHLIDGAIWAAGAFGFGYMIAGAFGYIGNQELHPA